MSRNPTPRIRNRPDLLLSSLLCGAVLALSGTGAAAQSAAPYSGDRCASDRNGLNFALRESRSCASATAVGSYGYGGAGIGNGVDASTSNGDGFAASEWRQDGWENRAMSGTGSGGNAWAASDLSTGQLRSVSENSWTTTNRGGVQTFTLARMGDVLTLVNDTGVEQRVSFGYQFDGGFVGGSGSGGGFNEGYVTLSVDSNSGLTMADSGSLIGSSMTTTFDVAGGYTQAFSGGSAADRSFSRFGDSAHGVFGGSAVLDFILPPGESDLVFAFTLYVGCGSYETACDFGNTGTLAFGDLVPGVSFHSQSGVFLSEMTTPVPEPASVALMALGLAGVAGAARRRARR